jgi:hypothetical protein
MMAVPDISLEAMRLRRNEAAGGCLIACRLGDEG